MRAMEANVLIDAPVGRVWDVLTDLPNYARWNPFIRSAAGRLRPGAPVELIVQIPGRWPVTVLPEVLEVETDRRLRWRGPLPGSKDFIGEHTFDLQPLGRSLTLLRQRGVYEGSPAPHLMSLIWETEEGWGRMNMALKTQIEMGFKSRIPRAS